MSQNPGKLTVHSAHLSSTSTASPAVLPMLCFSTTAPRMQCGTHLPLPMTLRTFVELHPATSRNHLTEDISLESTTPQIAVK